MRCVFISDIHIRCCNDQASKLLKKFLEEKKVLNAERIYFLGDIFDLLIGQHEDYLEKYSFFFQSIVELLNQGKKIIYVEGNHDFHFEVMIKNYLKTQTPLHHNFSYERRGSVLELNGKKYFYCHGYEVDFHNKYFKRWYRIYSSKLFNFFCSSILSFNLLQKLGKLASKDSKRRGKKTFDYQQMKQKYLRGAQDLIHQQNVAGIIAGHTHVKEFHFFDDGSLYINCGLPIKDKVYIYFDSEEFHFSKLSV